MNSNKPSLLDEFKTLVAVNETHPNLARMASARWASGLVSAIHRHSGNNKTIVQQITNQYKIIAVEASKILTLDIEDKRILNVIYQLIQAPAQNELETTGKLSGLWLGSFITTIKELPVVLQSIETPDDNASSLSMTLTKHYSELIALTNDFSFLRDNAEVVRWAHGLIEKIALQNAKQLQVGDETTWAYQNQLNSLRTMFVGAYRAESEQWKPLLEKEPSTKSLYPQGMPLTGIELRFSEQSQLLGQLIGLTPEKPHDFGHTR